MQPWEDEELEYGINDFGDYSIGSFAVGYIVYDREGMHVDNHIYTSHTDAYEKILELRKQNEQ